jgi:site-specific DNA-methyltransferase (adenine-specific)
MRIEEVGGAVLINADCRVAMAAMDENSVDAIVCDPPYGLTQGNRKTPAPHRPESPYGRSRMGVNGDTLAIPKVSTAGGFMGMGWDHGVPGVEFWVEALRVAKPGAYLLAFGGTRTHHRLMVAIEDAGWEVRDVVMWVYGSGFPKSHNGVWGGTALKPAWEPIIVARKPLIGTVAENVRAHGTGGLNIDGCRVPVDVDADAAQIRTMQRGQRTEDTSGQEWGLSKNGGDVPQVIRPDGRWPANLIHDGSEEVLAAFPNAKGQLAPSVEDGEPQGNSIYSSMNRGGPHHIPRDELDKSAARFFYCAKASKSDRDEGCDTMPDRVLAMSNQAKAEQARGNLNVADSGMNTGKVRKNSHPTVKPTALMQYLCRLVTPPGGTILDPFMGSGSTGKAALKEGFKFVGIELDEEHGYFDIALARIKAAILPPQ